MKLTFLGSGSAFTVGNGNYQSNILLQADSKRNLLIDCGTDVRFSLHEQGFNYRDIHDVYISHLHADHVGGLEWLAFNKKFNQDPPEKPNLYLHNSLKEDLWNHVLSGGLSSLEDLKADISNYFNVTPVDTSLKFTWEGIEIKLIKTIHTISDNLVLPSFGLFIMFKKRSFLITTDSRFTPEIFKTYYEDAQLIFQDCEVCAKCSGLHARYEDLKQLDPSIKKKMWLYHYQPVQLPDAQGDGFKGFVSKGQSFEL